jgi:TPP-dependent 2-oxoacid decarboxylase
MRCSTTGPDRGVTAPQLFTEELSLKLPVAPLTRQDTKELKEGMMSSSPGRRMKIGDFLLRRLAEAGIRHLFGVPGDYNLELLQQLQDSGALKWIGTCSELNAPYAADGYARLNGLGALLVTNSVGALSAINGVGGSHSKQVPVICVAGSIPLRSIDRGLGMHHTMADGTYDHFLDAYAHHRRACQTHPTQRRH